MKFFQNVFQTWRGGQKSSFLMNFDADAISNMATKAKTATLQVDMLDYTEGYPQSFFTKAKRNSPQFFRHGNFRHIFTIHK